MAATNEQTFSLRTRKVVDPDSLLTEEDKAPKQATVSDCSTRGRACKNCVCGRAELEAKAVAEGRDPASVTAAPPPSGGCGSCARGDAFRCATCPYRGTPAWSTASDGKVTLNLTDDVDM